MPRSPIGWLLTVAVPVAAVGLAYLLAGPGRHGSDVDAQAAEICAETRRELDALPQTPADVAEGLEIEHRLLAILRRELARLQELAPRTSDAFQAGVADDQKLVAGLSSMVRRPDFVRLSLTLPGHPSLVPDWMRRWLAREQALQAGARAGFSKAGVPTCEKVFG